MVACLGSLCEPPSSHGVLLKRVEALADMALQPIADIRSGAVLGFEALVRNTAAIGFPSIGAFFDYAHGLDVLCDIDNVLYAKAAGKFLRRPGMSDDLLFINFDRRRIAGLQDSLPSLLRCLDINGLSPANICIEIAESGSETSCDELVKAVGALRRCGFHLAIDDFGTGHSGLQALYQCQPDFVKIDRFFISDLDRDARKRLFVTRIVELAHVLGIKVVAEGVERVEELLACRDAGCDLVQGFFVARPTQAIAELQSVYEAVPDPIAARDFHTGRHIGRPELTLEAEGVIAAVTPFPDSTRLDVVVEYFLTNPECSYLPVVDSRSGPRGVVRERDLRRLVQLPFGRDLLSNQACPLTLKDFAVRVPVVEATMCSELVVDQSADLADEGMIVTKNSRYFGMVTSNSLVRLASKVRLRQVSNENPLTHLPANDAILTFIDTACRDTHETRVLCYLDFDNFKPFNDVYGFHLGDRAIMMFADILKSEFAGLPVFLGHIGGDDFFAAASGEAAATLQARLPRIQRRFQTSVESLYSAEHRLKGSIECSGRDGVKRAFALLTCSAGLVRLLPGETIGSPADAAKTLAWAKCQAKKTFGLKVWTPRDDDGEMPAQQNAENKVTEFLPAACKNGETAMRRERVLSAFPI